MNSVADSWYASFGFLRLGLYALALLNVLLSIITLAMDSGAAAAEPPLWTIITLNVTPVMAPLFVVVIFFDYVMSRVRAADSQGDERALYVRIGRVELAVIGITLLYWIPFFVNRF